jgi:hypothetical protein
VGEIQILVELFGTWGSVLLFGFQFVGGPNRDFEGCTVAEDQGGFCGEFLIRAVAGWEWEAIWLGGQ